MKTIDLLVQLYRAPKTHYTVSFAQRERLAPRIKELQESTDDLVKQPTATDASHKMVIGAYSTVYMNLREATLLYNGVSGKAVTVSLKDITKWQFYLLWFFRWSHGLWRGKLLITSNKELLEFLTHPKFDVF